jgi:hypothetical protein
LIDQSPEAHSFQNDLALVFGGDVEGIEVGHEGSTFREKDRILWHGNDALTEGGAVDFMERRVGNCDVLGAGRERVQKTEEKEDC